MHQVRVIGGKLQAGGRLCGGTEQQRFAVASGGTKRFAVASGGTKRFAVASGGTKRFAVASGGTKRFAVASGGTKRFAVASGGTKRFAVASGGTKRFAVASGGHTREGEGKRGDKQRLPPSPPLPPASSAHHSLLLLQLSGVSPRDPSPGLSSGTPAAAVGLHGAWRHGEWQGGRGASRLHSWVRCCSLGRGSGCARGVAQGDAGALPLPFKLPPFQIRKPGLPSSFCFSVFLALCCCSCWVGLLRPTPCHVPCCRVLLDAAVGTGQQQETAQDNPAGSGSGSTPILTTTTSWQVT
ncbi:hypothetical protein CLOM_g10928 [Closterium sp. NIES-68]|nr:hypothetical protein CLOM_g10928 [Closterium sp. NIES-68]GJP57792.1 hypothetical protein CLOP_g17385 [Closterium sp. NIES-67]